MIGSRSPVPWPAGGDPASPHVTRVRCQACQGSQELGLEFCTRSAPSLPGCLGGICRETAISSTRPPADRCPQESSRATGLSGPGRSTAAAVLGTSRSGVLTPSSGRDPGVSSPAKGPAITYSTPKTSASGPRRDPPSSRHSLGNFGIRVSSPLKKQPPAPPAAFSSHDWASQEPFFYTRRSLTDSCIQWWHR